MIKQAQHQTDTSNLLVTMTIDQFRLIVREEAEKVLLSRDINQLMTAKEVSVMFGQSVDTTNSDARTGKLPGFKIPGKNGWFFNKKDINDFWMEHYQESKI